MRWWQSKERRSLVRHPLPWNRILMLGSDGVRQTKPSPKKKFTGAVDWISIAIKRPPPLFRLGTSHGFHKGR